MMLMILMMLMMLMMLMILMMWWCWWYWWYWFWWCWSKLSKPQRPISDALMLVHCICVFRVFGGYFCIWFFCKVTIILSNKFSNNHRYLATEISSFQLLKVFAVLVRILIHMPGSCCFEDIFPPPLCPFCFLAVVLSEWNITAFIILPLLCFP